MITTDLNVIWTGKTEKTKSNVATERAGREEERQRREAEYKKNRESGEHRGQQRHDRDQKEHEFESKPPRDMKMAAKELGISLKPSESPWWTTSRDTTGSKETWYQ
ncbi:MAG: hypothetical protein CM1200mP15_14150 [Dehalococcoidia bacterium]|nr:MAG: hypothetical protein CM1200mP15_14150 [Dehalococcoidia bacterium]